ncbi:hypothetical protein [uncultured Roseobacter sp.]|uniref:hypothetical protein n=1 Tax=uncultured Roseobacter sp. TaxID=114847 RepID=UPI002612E093|nr:hypothetical protein [uncultured Roseobacter sp.]
MTQSIITTLRTTTTFEDSPEATFSGEVSIRLLGIDRIELVIPQTRCEIGIERGSDEHGQPGWYIYPEDTKQWDNGQPVEEEERVEITRLLTAALSTMGYQVWTD